MLVKSEDFDKFIDLLDRDTKKYQSEFRHYSNKILSFIPQITEKILDGEKLKQNYIDDTLFNAIITNTDKEADELFIKKQLLKNYKDFPFWKRSLVVSAISISLINTYDEQKMNLLIDFINANENLVWQKALVGLLLALHNREVEILKDPALVNRLSDLFSHQKVEVAIEHIIDSFEHIRENEDDILDLVNGIEIDTIMEYFEKPAHWFLPFYDNNPVINDSSIKEPLISFLVKSCAWTAPIIKYAFCKNYEYFTDFQRKRVSEMLEYEKADFIKDYEQSFLHKKYPDMDCMQAYYSNQFIFSETINEFYIFYSLFSKNQFQNIFEHIKQIEFQASFYRVTSKKTSTEISKKWFDIGLEYLELDDHIEATECFQKSINADFNNYELYYKIGQNYVQNQLYDQAIECYKKVIDLKPDNQAIWVDLGSIFNAKSMKNKALECYEKAIELNSKDYNNYTNIGFAYLKFGDIILSENYLIKSIELGCKDYGNMNLGHVYLAKRDEDLALKTYIESVVNFKNKDKFFEGFDDDFQHLMQYDITKELYNAVKEKIKKFC